MDEFNFDPRPVYEYDQVITEDELRLLYSDLKAVYDDTSGWRFIAKAELLGSLIALGMLIEWLRAGKPANIALIMFKKEK